MMEGYPIDLLAAQAQTADRVPWHIGSVHNPEGVRDYLEMTHHLTLEHSTELL